VSDENNRAILRCRCGTSKRLTGTRRERKGCSRRHHNNSDPIRIKMRCLLIISGVIAAPATRYGDALKTRQIIAIRKPE
jgi:hypothetical protein